MTDVNDWPTPPGTRPLRTGQLIRYKQTFREGGKEYRVGGLEPRIIIAETPGYIIYNVWTSGGAFLSEEAITREEFNQKFERGPIVQYVEEEGA